MTPAPVAAGRLAVCPTPIGNLQDVTLRVLATVAAADVVACEDTRHTGTLLARHGISARLVSLHEHNERARAADLVGRIRSGALVALVSDAGTPLVADPGYALVAQCLSAGLAVEVLPGPSAVITALIASGLATDRWCYAGFLPRSAPALRALLGDLRHTLVAFESPRRLPATLALLAELDAQRAAAVCRELTKLHEEVDRASAAELAERYAQRAAERALRGEVVLVIEAASPRVEKAAQREQAEQALRELIGAGARPRAAAAVVARLTGARANELYRRHARERPAAAQSRKRR